jgi:hypothetical protein
MSPASADIALFRRWNSLGQTVRYTLLAVLIVGSMMLWMPQGIRLVGSGLVILAMLVYVALWMLTLKSARRAAEAPDLIARREYDLAERLLRQSIGGFSLAPINRLGELYNLAVLRQVQSRYAESADLTGFILSARQRTPFEIPARLVRLEAVLELGNLAAAHAELLRLWSFPLPVNESGRLLLAALRYEAAVGAHEHSLAGLPAKLKLAQTLGAEGYAKAHAHLASAARNSNRPDLARWLQDRSDLVAGTTPTL